MLHDRSNGEGGGQVGLVSLRGERPVEVKKRHLGYQVVVSPGLQLLVDLLETESGCWGTQELGAEIFLLFFFIRLIIIYLLLRADFLGHNKLKLHMLES